jgi:hypothetical protein
VRGHSRDRPHAHHLHRDVWVAHLRADAGRDRGASARVALASAAAGLRDRGRERHLSVGCLPFESRQGLCGLAFNLGGRYLHIAVPANGLEHVRLALERIAEVYKGQPQPPSTPAS